MDGPHSVACELCGHCWMVEEYERETQCPACLRWYDVVRDWFGRFRGIKRRST